jgi:hypothetical protein
MGGVDYLITIHASTQDERCLISGLADRCQGLKAVQYWHIVIGNNNVGILFPPKVEELLAILSCADNGVAKYVEQVSEYYECVIIVIR